MRRRSIMLGFAFAAIIVFAFVVAPALQAETTPRIPFDGMSMVYHATTSWNTELFTRSVVVLKVYAETNSVLVKDGEDYVMIDATTREIIWGTGWFEDKEGSLIEYWISTDVKIGSNAGLPDPDVYVTGSEVLSVEGRDVECWQVSGPFTVVDGPAGIGTWLGYYSKKNGLWIGATALVTDQEEHALWLWTQYLASTNVPL